MMTSQEMWDNFRETERGNIAVAYAIFETVESGKVLVPGQEMNSVIVQNNPVNWSDPFGTATYICTRWMYSGKPTSFMNPFRHEYLKIGGDYYGWNHEGNFWNGEGVKDRSGNDAECIYLICDDPKFDRIAKEEADYYTTSYFNFLSLNCHWYVQAVLMNAQFRYLQEESCPKCFQ